MLVAMLFGIPELRLFLTASDIDCCVRFHISKMPLENVRPMLREIGYDINHGVGYSSYQLTFERLKSKLEVPTSFYKWSLYPK